MQSLIFAQNTIPRYDCGLAQEECLGSSRTRDGAVLEIRFRTDIEPPNRGFVAHETSAWIGSEKVGYLISTYAPKARFAVFNPTIWHFANNFSGGFPGLSGRNTEGFDPYGLPVSEFDRFARRALEHLECRGEIPDMLDRQAFDALAAGTFRYRAYQKDRERFVSFHVDKPYVGFVGTKGNPLRGTFRDHSGRGIAVVLYVATAKHLAREGLVLHASSLQSDRASSIWDRFRTRGWTELRDDGKRLALVAHRLPDRYFRPNHF